MTLAGLAAVLLLQLCCAYHVLKTGRRFRWIVLIVGLPLIGCAIYLISAVLPTLQRDAIRNKARKLLAIPRAAAGSSAASAYGDHAAQARLRIVFADHALAYTVASPYAAPLGGTQSAVCYLAEALASAGHEIFLITNNPSPAVDRGVVCLGWDHAPVQALRELGPDVVVSLAPDRGRDLRGIFGDETRIAFWTGHAPDQPSVQCLRDAEVRNAYDGYAFMSRWQQQGFAAAFGVEPSRSQVLGNALAPAFRNLFAADAAMSAAKARPPVLAYTSTPFRGLNILLDAFPEIRRRVPGTRLQVFSDMRVYQVDRAHDEATYGELYRKCRETAGVEYVGTLPQPALAQELRHVTALAYPNTFAETYCTAVIEAMAAGCRIVTSELGALPDTTAGFARLIPIVGRAETYARDFIEAVVETLHESLAGADADLLARQVDYVNTRCNWEVRALEWAAWLRALPRT